MKDNEEKFTNYYHTQFPIIENNIIRDHLEEIEEEEEHIINNPVQTMPIQTPVQPPANVPISPYLPVPISPQPSASDQTAPPDINKHLMNNPIPPNNGYTPLNINISYNSQNSINELENESNSDDKEYKRKKELNHNLSKNLGNNDNTRIFNNSDWIYGQNAWTNNPDYYIPLKDAKKNETSHVSPLMINTPWSEYKSGDSDPDPYNI